MQLSPRQKEILRRVVEEYVATGQPVGSKYLVERAGLRVSPSTVRAGLDAFVAETQADELIVASAIWEHRARLRSYELLSELALK